MIRTGTMYRYFVVTICLVFLAGCWDHDEIDDLALVMASGFDLTDDGQLEFSLQIALPTGIPTASQAGGKGQKPFLFVTAKGKTGYEIIGKLQTQLSRRIFFGLRGVIVFGESFAKKGMNQFLDPLIRFPDARFSHVVTTYGITAKELLQSPYLLESIPAIGIRNILLSRSAIDIKIDEFLDGVAARDRSPITAAVSLNAKDKENPTYLIDRAAVYRGNKLVGFLSPEETNLFRMWSKDVNALSLYTQLERENRDFKGLVTIGALDVKTKVQTKIKNQIPEATIVYTIHARIIENETELDMSKPEHLHRLEAKIARETEEKLNKMMTRLQKEFKSDIYGLGKEVHIQNPYYWKKVQDSWFAIYPEVPVTTKVEIKIEQMGRTRAPVHTKK